MNRHAHNLAFDDGRIDCKATIHRAANVLRNHAARILIDFDLPHRGRERDGLSH